MSSVFEFGRLGVEIFAGIRQLPAHAAQLGTSEPQLLDRILGGLGLGRVLDGEALEFGDLLAEQISFVNHRVASGKYLDQIANGIWLICEESFWGVPAHLYIQKADLGLPDPRDPIVDLFAAQTAALVATAVYLLGDTLDKVLKEATSEN